MAPSAPPEELKDIIEWMLQDRERERRVIERVEATRAGPPLDASHDGVWRRNRPWPAPVRHVWPTSRTPGTRPSACGRASVGPFSGACWVTPWAGPSR